MARKHSLTELTAVNSDKNASDQDEKLTAVNSESGGHSEGSEPAESSAVKTSRRAIGAVSRSFEKLKQKGEVNLDPNLIDPAPIKDRIEIEGPRLDRLTAQIEQHGQQVAILVRPHPDNPERYQLAYGRRRTAATKALGISVRAIVRELTDKELVLAQGQENNEREDLTFIEKALYAVNLEEGGFDRPTIMAALSVDKTTCSRLISTVKRISREVIEAVGSAPNIGRDRWVDLAARMKDRSIAEIASELIGQDSFQSRDSDARFEYLAKKLAPRTTQTKRSSSDFWLDEQGLKVTQIKRSEKATVLLFSQETAPEFGDFVLKSLPELYAKYKKGKEN